MERRVCKGQDETELGLPPPKLIRWNRRDGYADRVGGQDRLLICKGSICHMFKKTRDQMPRLASTIREDKAGNNKWLIM